MAGENAIMEPNLVAKRYEAHLAPTVNEPTKEAQLSDSIWQMAKVGLAFQKPYGEPLERQKERTEAELSKPGMAPELLQKNEPIKRFGPPSRIIPESVKMPVEETREASDSAKITRPVEPTVEQRKKFVEQLAMHINEQQYRSNFELVGLGTALGGFALARASTPAGLAVMALGIGTSLYNGFSANSANAAGREVLRQMPKLDAQRFGQYESDVNSARQATAYGYIAGGGLSLMSMSKMTPYLNSNTSALAYLAAIGNNVIQTQYRMPRAISNFHADVNRWNKELSDQ